MWRELLSAEVAANPEQAEAALNAAETAAKALWHALDGMEARRMVTAWQRSSTHESGVDQRTLKLTEDVSP